MRGRRAEERRGSEDKMGLKQAMQRRIATAAMDELQTAIYKATTDDKLAPKEKHVQTTLRLAAEKDSSAHAAAELLRRLRDCREPRAAGVATKTLTLLHRLMHGGCGDCLHVAVLDELSFVCGEGKGEARHAQAAACAQTAAYLQQLGRSYDATKLRGERSDAACAAWNGAPLDELLGFLPTLQPLVERALACARLDGAADDAVAALRAGVIEDALELTRLEGAVAARLLTLLFQLQPHMVSAKPGGALDALEIFSSHARTALILQQSLSRTPSSAAAEAILSRSILWPSSRAAVEAEEDASPVPRARLPDAPQTKQVVEERDALARQLLALLPAATLSSLTDRAMGRPLQSVSEITDDDLHHLPMAQLLQAARHIKKPSDPSAAAPPSRPPALSLAELQQGGLLVLPGGGLTVTALTSGGDAPPPPPREKVDSERGGLPPLPVVPGEVYPALPHDVEAAALGLAAYECLLLTVQLPPARVEDVQVVRTRLGISLKQHKRLVPLLKLPPPEASSSLRDLLDRSVLPASGSPAYRALLAAFAAPPPPPEQADRSHILSFLQRQIAVLRCSLRDGAAPAARLQAHAERLLLLRAEGKASVGELVAEEEQALRTTLAEFGVGKGESERAALARHWPAEIGYRLYCALLEATFDADEPSLLADNAAEMASLLQCTWPSLQIDAGRHHLAKLSVCFDHYQRSGAPALLALIDEALTACLAPGPNGAGAEAHARLRSEVLAGMVSFLSGKLKDYHAHYACDPEEMWASVSLWRRCVLSLSAPQKASPSASADAAVLADQARRLIESSVRRQVARLRVAVEDDVRRGVAQRGPDEMEVLALIGNAMANEFEDEVFSPAFNKCMGPTRKDEKRGPATDFALQVLERETADRLQRALPGFTIISSPTIAAVTAFVPLQRLLRRESVPEPLPQLTQLCVRMVDGWCAQLRSLLEESLQRMLSNETWQPLTERAHGASMVVSSSAVDVFVELDRLVQVYAHVGSLQKLPTDTHEQVASLLGKQATEYVQRILAGCAHRTPSRLEGERAGEAPRGGGGGGRSAALDQQSLRELLLRLNACEWAGQQFLALANRLRVEVADGAELASLVETPRRCEAACKQMLEYIQGKLVFYDFGPFLTDRLYVPSPAKPEGRLVELLHKYLEPAVREISSIAAPRHAQKLLEGVLGNLCFAYAASLELPGRSFAPVHKAILTSDLDALRTAFVSKHLLENEVVQYCVSYLYALANNACSGT